MEQTVQCPNGHKNSAGSNYCGDCGAPLAALCANGHRNAAGQHYCGECGVSMPVGAEAPHSRHHLSETQDARRHRDDRSEPNAGDEYDEDDEDEGDEDEGEGDRDGESELDLANLPPERTYFQQLRDEPGLLFLILLVILLVAAALLWLLWGTLVLFLGGSDSHSASGGSQTADHYATATETAVPDESSDSGSRIPASTPDDWYRAVCRPGTIVQDVSVLPNADGQDQCSSGQSGIIIGVYHSSLIRDNDLARFRMLRHATITDDNGNIWVFFESGNSGALEPLRQFGFYVS